MDGYLGLNKNEPATRIRRKYRNRKNHKKTVIEWKNKKLLLFLLKRAILVGVSRLFD